MLTGGAEAPRDLPVPGRELAGIHFAMEFLPQQNKVVAGDRCEDQICATGKHVIVIGGGDTGSDCVGTSNRHGAKSVTQFELLPQPPENEDKPLVWPYWPIKLRTSSSHEEGCERDWAVATKRFEGRNGKVEKLVAVRVEWRRTDGREDGRDARHRVRDEGRSGAARDGLPRPGADGLARSNSAWSSDARSNVQADTTSGYRTSVPKVFAAGDMRRGQSLVVWAIREGRQCARAVDEFLMGSSGLPR